jgi:hypothetical protein
MRVKFTYNQEDLVDATVRFSARSKSLRALRNRRRLWSALLMWVIMWALFRFSIIGALIGVGAGMVVLLADLLWYNRQYRRNLRKLFRDTYGDENEFVCQVELTPEALKTSGKDCQHNTGWEMIEEVISTNDSVDIFGRQGKCVIVRNRAFGSVEDRQRFIELAREYMNRAQAPNPEK